MQRNVMFLLMLMATGCTSITEKPVFATEGVALQGYDVVAYYIDNKAVKGTSEHQINYLGSQWHFSRAENAALFAANPKAYAPQYGGYCAYAMANDFVVETDPKAFSVLDNKLYLNYSMSVRETWLTDPKGYIQEADENWLKKSHTE